MIDVMKFHANSISTMIEACLKHDSFLNVSVKGREVKIETKGKTLEQLFCITSALDVLIEQNPEVKGKKTPDNMKERLGCLNDYFSLIIDLYLGLAAYQQTQNIMETLDSKSLEVLLQMLKMKGTDKKQFEEIIKEFENNKKNS